MKEICWDGEVDTWPAATKPSQNNWYDGELNKNTDVTAGNSKLAAVHWSSSLRVIYQQTDGSLKEHCRNDTDPWFAGSTLPCPSDTQPYKGTAIAGVSRDPSNPDIHIFFQCNSGYIYKAQYNGSWTISNALFIAKLGTSIAAVLLPGKNVQCHCQQNLFDGLTNFIGNLCIHCQQQWRTRTPQGR